MAQARKGTPPKASTKAKIDSTAPPASENPPADPQPDPRVAELEAEVATLEAKVEELEATAEAAPADTGSEQLSGAPLEFVRRIASGKTGINYGDEARKVLDDLDLPYRG